MQIGSWAGGNSIWLCIWLKRLSLGYYASSKDTQNAKKYLFDVLRWQNQIGGRRLLKSVTIDTFVWQIDKGIGGGAAGSIPNSDHPGSARGAEWVALLQHYSSECKNVLLAACSILPSFNTAITIGFRFISLQK